MQPLPGETGERGDGDDAMTPLFMLVLELLLLPMLLLLLPLLAFTSEVAIVA